MNSQTRLSAKRLEVECVISKHVQKKKKYKKVNSTESRNGGEIKNQRQSMVNRNKNHVTEVISNMLI